MSQLRLSFQYFLFIEVTAMPLCSECSPKVILETTNRRVCDKMSGRKQDQIQGRKPGHLYKEQYNLCTLKNKTVMLAMYSCFKGGFLNFLKHTSETSIGQV